jgi:hypothetical protein
MAQKYTDLSDPEHWFLDFLFFGKKKAKIVEKKKLRL